MVKGTTVVLKKDERFLLQLRDDVPTINHPNKWGLFGGHLEKGEEFIEAAIREIKEELEIELKKDKLKLILEGKMNNIDFSIFYYLEDINPEDIILHEGQKFGLFSKEEIFELENTAIGLKRLFKNYL